MGLMAAASGDAPHDEILVESCTSRHRFQSWLLWCGALMYTVDTSSRSCDHLRSSGIRLSGFD
jgi:hypothetical protein